MTNLKCIDSITGQNNMGKPVDIDVRQPLWLCNNQPNQQHASITCVMGSKNKTQINCREEPKGFQRERISISNQLLFIKVRQKTSPHSNYKPPTISHNRHISFITVIVYAQHSECQIMKSLTPISILVTFFSKSLEKHIHVLNLLNL